MSDHKHKFNQLVLIPTMTKEEPTGILARKCACGAKHAFECGPRDAMVALGKKLKERIYESKTENGMDSEVGANMGENAASDLSEKT